MEHINWSSVKFWRSHGVDARWSKRGGRPVMMVRPSHSESYYVLTRDDLEAIAANIDNGTRSLRQAVDYTYAVCDVFSIPV